MQSKVEKGQEQASLPNRNTETQLSAASSKKIVVGRDLAPPQVPFLLQILILCCLGLVALIPRIILANQLDLITDEIIYILAGKSYLPLLKHITTTIGTDGWQVNYEHPPLVKFLIGLSILINDHAGHPFNELLAARIPGIIAGTVLIMATYWLGRKPFGHIVALLAALCLALSPWLVYFSSIAYLDMTMTTFITIAYLLTWHATRRPWLYLCVALFVGLGIDSKYTAALVIPGILLFTAYYYFILRLRLPVAQRSPIPWRWWLTASILAPLCFFALDPVIWSHPRYMLAHSVLYEWNHSVGGHLTFLAGSYDLHVPHWTVLYIIFNKISTFVTIPAALFSIVALIQLIRFHLPVRREQHKEADEAGIHEAGDEAGIHEAGDRKGREGASPSSTHLSPPQRRVDNALALLRPLRPPFPPQEATALAFLLIWLLTTLTMFSLLNIVVGTHYLLPLAPPIVIAGTYILVYLARYGTRKIGTAQSPVAYQPATPAISPDAEVTHRSRFRLPPVSRRGRRKARPLRLSFVPGAAPKFALMGLVLCLIGAVLVGPHLLGLLNTPEAEGYTSEFFRGENQTLQVAYPGYREAIQWLDTYTQGDKRIGLVALPQTLWRGDQNVSWFAYNSNVPKRLQIQEAHPKDPSYPYDYLVWPMHLIQRGYALPQSWHIIHSITGGDTTYCYIATSYETHSNP
jgi:4-amino-4-deoxy-L-arabinose transferase-like glycosyltransferase